MTHLIFALASFAFVSSITPGPNNLMLMSSGATYGFKRTLPHMMGVVIGFTLMVLILALGVAEIFEAEPMFRQGLVGISTVYMIWLAAKIARSGAPEAGGVGEPMGFFAACAFQWVNPKAWVMAIGAGSLYAGLGPVWIAVIFGLVNLPCIAVWVVLGRLVAGLLGQPWRLRAFNGLMAILLILSLAPVLELAK